MMYQVYSGLSKVFNRCSQTSLSSVEFIFQPGVRKLSALREPKIIRIPATMARTIKEAEITKEKRDQEKKKKQSQQGNKSVPVISCKRSQFNHYKGQSYSKFDEVPLASKGWHHYKSAGDYFTINSMGGNPAFAHMKDEVCDFDSLGLSRDILEEIEKLGFKVPTNIQALAIPHIIEGKNTLITAETGNGKTLAFLAPLLQQIRKYKDLNKDLPMNTPLGLIIVPGRELAEQIHAVASAMSEDLEINVELVKGGRTKNLMRYPKVGKVHLIVATIGALSKLTTNGIYDVSLVRHIVVDEADSLLDDSFSEALLRYMSKFPIQGTHMEDTSQPIETSGIQLTLVSATLPRSLHTILDPIVNLESIERIDTPYLHRIQPHVPQQFLRVNSVTKESKLLELARSCKSKGLPVIIFSNNSKTCDWLSLFLNENGISCVNLNGYMPAIVRNDQFRKFQDGEVIALSCTDLASRGLDTSKAAQVINFEFPKFISDYIHRCGRIGRVGSTHTGKVTNLVHRPSEIELVQKIEYAARKSEEYHNVNANIKRRLTGKDMEE
ncbi:probable ATP-dependent RNA helicase DDX28 [Palaemon carinicauda]|uniref:probable ATP-dependent RNA helicase DDX28 n=1 Tax=Palaemon carinicauda TaxID=392227 RepID=UPI0035B65C12